MSKNPDRAEVVARLYSELPLEDQRQALTLILGRDINSPKRWMTLAEVADSLEVSRSQASRYAAAGRLLTNGKVKKAYRIALTSMLLFHCERIRDQSASYLRNYRSRMTAIKIKEWEAVHTWAENGCTMMRTWVAEDAAAVRLGLI
jgi:hypothetical protein